MTARPRWRSYLLLSRVSNLPTVWTNVLAGMFAAQGAVQWDVWVRLGAGVSLLYTAGMFLNDAADHQFDARHRPDRPIPAGEVSVRTAVTVGIALIVAGLAIVGAQERMALPLLWAGLLMAAILYYDYRHKRDPLGPLVMGLCRGLVYAVAASAVAGAVSGRVLFAAACLAAYVWLLTLVAKRLGVRGRVIVPMLIAGICLVDAVVVRACGGSVGMALLAASGFGLTLILQRGVPGD